ncbi:hypothetical protein AYI68_g7984 [Smittium mucronatum]|uniref:Uncharacterized protein n=1 Tax=Smittium mucronatum TaxID=133383 RepID=A0A1R0GM49_9FUNG|nr:hypothetical protein AYI68_g7984 [Smittium mucronatum]
MKLSLNSILANAILLSSIAAASQQPMEPQAKNNDGQTQQLSEQEKSEPLNLELAEKDILSDEMKIENLLSKIDSNENYEFNKDELAEIDQILTNANKYIDLENKLEIMDNDQSNPQADDSQDVYNIEDSNLNVEESNGDQVLDNSNMNAEELNSDQILRDSNMEVDDADKALLDELENALNDEDHDQINDDNSLNADGSNPTEKAFPALVPDQPDILEDSKNV